MCIPCVLTLTLAAVAAADSAREQADLGHQFEQMLSGSAPRQTAGSPSVNTTPRRRAVSMGPATGPSFLGQPSGHSTPHQETSF
eukprot:132897-Prorocentrum_minimum.AAC.1